MYTEINMNACLGLFISKYKCACSTYRLAVSKIIIILLLRCGHVRTHIYTFDSHTATPMQTWKFYITYIGMRMCLPI